MERYFIGMKALSTLANVWPDVTELRQCAGKLHLSANLDVIASHYTHTRRPLLALLKHREDDSAQVDIPNPLPTNVVFKRTHSETGRHVLLPDLPLETKQKRLGERVDIPGARWFMQAFTPFMKTHGEIRMFFVGGKNIYNMHTVKNLGKGDDVWDFQVAETVLPLDIVK